MTALISERQQMVIDFMMWLSDTKRFTAPYGILDGKGVSKRGMSYRSVTFGVARVSDITLMVFSTTYMILKDSRFGDAQCKSIQEVKDQLTEWYRL